MTCIIVEDPQDLANAKQRGQSYDRLERKLIPDVDKTLYLVIGFTGKHELGTYRFWPVRLFRNESTAEAYCTACSQHANLWLQQRDSYTQSPPYSWSRLDPNMIMSYEGTYYRVYPVPIELSLHTAQEDVCPICHTQLTATPTGYICENGHEL